MTDEIPAAIPAATVCEREGCHVLVPDTLEDRREHRQGHTHDDKVEEAIRRALRELRADFDTLRGETRDAVRDIRDEVAGIDREVKQIEIPEPVAPLTISRGGWDDDDDTTSPSDVDDEDWGFAKPDPEPQTTTEQPSAGVQADENDEPDQEPDPKILTPQTPAWAR